MPIESYTKEISGPVYEFLRPALLNGQKVKDYDKLPLKNSTAFNQVCCLVTSIWYVPMIGHLHLYERPLIQLFQEFKVLGVELFHVNVRTQQGFFTNDEAEHFITVHGHPSHLMHFAMGFDGFLQNERTVENERWLNSVELQAIKNRMAMHSSGFVKIV